MYFFRDGYNRSDSYLFDKKGRKFVINCTANSYNFAINVNYAKLPSQFRTKDYTKRNLNKNMEHEIRLIQKTEKQ